MNLRKREEKYGAVFPINKAELGKLSTVSFLKGIQMELSKNLFFRLKTLKLSKSSKNSTSIIITLNQTQLKCETTSTIQCTESICVLSTNSKMINMGISHIL